MADLLNQQQEQTVLLKVSVSQLAYLAWVFDELAGLAVEEREIWEEPVGRRCQYCDQEYWYEDKNQPQQVEHLAGCKVLTLQQYSQRLQELKAAVQG